MSKASKIKPADINDITLDSVKGYHEEKEEIKKFINLLQNFKDYKNQGIYIPRGLIIQGPPGCGKTLLAKAIASECNLPFYNFQAENSGEETLKKLIETFKVARENSPSIIYIDEIDKLVDRRYFGSDIVRSLTQYLLTELDGLNTQEGLMLIASTNEYQDIPDSLLRSGRMDKRIKIGFPDLESRIEMLDYYMSSYDKFKNINTKRLAVKIEGLTGADIKTLVNNTLINCMDSNADISEDDFLTSVTELNFEDIGKRWKNPRAREDVIIHECGHSVVSYILTNNHGAINCLKYGNSAGHTSFFDIDKDEEDFEFEEDDEADSEEFKIKESYTRVDKNLILKYVCISLGGMIAEEEFFGTHFAGCISDLGNAQNLLDRLVTNLWLGPKCFYYRNKAKKIQERLFRKCMGRTRKIIRKNKELIIYLAKEVENHGDVLSYDQISNLIKNFTGEINFNV